MDKLITGGAQDPFLPHLCAAIGRADEIDFAVAFIMAPGLRLLLPDLHAALNINGHRGKAPACLRVLTSDYMDVTDPEALRLLMLLQQQGAEVRVFETAGSSFHLKAYLFTFKHAQHDGGEPSQAHELRGTAFIGSSNLSKQALTKGLEWNYRIDYPSDRGFLQARTQFDALFHHPQTVALSDAWIAEYEARRQVRKRVTPLQAIDAEATEALAPPTPTPIQTQALEALQHSRQAGYRRGLVVLATGLGKTWLAAFDAQRCGAQRVLFVAHREEILNQAADTFVRIRPQCRAGFYLGQTRDTEVDVLFASIQTLSRAEHLQGFAAQHFDYVVVDEFHHAAAHSYRRLLSHFQPRFLLGLTATPDRSDQSDILSLCDDNLVFSCGLFEGIGTGLLAPFHYYGIHDHSVDYREIPWRNGRFDPELIAHKLATHARARHALQQWQERGLSRTLAFCVSIRHAEFMAAFFIAKGIAAAAVYAGSALSRGEALTRLEEGLLQVIFSVDLFNEGVDLPAIDTVMMLRPTESKILFLQQLGRGLRTAPGKDKLVVLDFIGNHHSFLHKPQALFGIGASYRQLAEFARRLEQGEVELPSGCFLNYDLALIDFLKALDEDGLAREYEALKASLGHRPSRAEFYRAGANLAQVRSQYGSWFELVAAQGDLSAVEIELSTSHRALFKAIETSTQSTLQQLIVLQALQELDGWHTPPSPAALAAQCGQVLQRHPALQTQLADAPRATQPDADALTFWRDGPMRAWCQRAGRSTLFILDEQHFRPQFRLASEQRAVFADLVQELLDSCLAAFAARQQSSSGGSVIPLSRPPTRRVELPYFPDLKIACGHFRSASSAALQTRSLGPDYGELDPARHFIARASGHSMDGGTQPIRDGDYLLMELIAPQRHDTLDIPPGQIIALERSPASGDKQYLLRNLMQEKGGVYRLHAHNPTYEPLPVSAEMRPLARLKCVIDPLEFAIGQPYKREDIPALFGAEFNPGNWNSGHVVLNEQKAHVLLVTLNKQGKLATQRFHDYWMKDHTFHWESQNSTTPSSKRGREIIEHRQRGIAIHLFIRENKMQQGKSAPFVYYGKAEYLGHQGSKPMNVRFGVGD